jgi:hypothetical protein
LPTGAATEATLATRAADATITARLGTLGQKTSSGSAPVVIASDQSAVPVSGTVTANQGGAPWSVSGSGTFTVVQSTASNLNATVNASSWPLPTGAATAANQTPGNASLSSIDSKTPALGQAANAGSIPVTISSTQTGTAGVPSAQVLSVQGVSGGQALPISGTVTVTPSGTQTVNLAQVGSSAVALGQTTMSASIPVAIASNQGALVTAGTTPTTTAVSLTTTGATTFASATTSIVKVRKIYNRVANPLVYCVYYDGTNNVTSEATSSFAIQPGQTWEMPISDGIVEYTGPINCATTTSTGSVQALQVL